MRIHLRAEDGLLTSPSTLACSVLTKLKVTLDFFSGTLVLTIRVRAFDLNILACLEMLQHLWDVELFSASFLMELALDSYIAHHVAKDPMSFFYLHNAFTLKGTSGIVQSPFLNAILAKGILALRALHRLVEYQKANAAEQVPVDFLAFS